MSAPDDLEHRLAYTVAESRVTNVALAVVAAPIAIATLCDVVAFPRGVLSHEVMYLLLQVSALVLLIPSAVALHVAWRRFRIYVGVGRIGAAAGCAMGGLTTQAITVSAVVIAFS